MTMLPKSPLVLLLLILLLGGFPPPAAPTAADGEDGDDDGNGGNGLGDGCYWMGSGLSGPERGVSPVYLRCAQGRVEWAYPRGALRVLLRLGGGGADFRACVRLDASASGARLFLEGPRQLVPLFADDADANDASEAKCFRSKDGAAALYVETMDVAAPLQRHSLDLFYQLRPLNADAYPVLLPQIRDGDECRPCSAEELLRLYCVSDFVARGIMTRLSRRGGRSEVHVLASAVLRDVPRGPPVFALDPSADAGLRRRWRSTLGLPARCGATLGQGEFLFVGRMELGRPELTCAPQIHEWAMVRAEAMATGVANCTLEA